MSPEPNFSCVFLFFSLCSHFSSGSRYVCSPFPSHFPLFLSFIFFTIHYMFFDILPVSITHLPICAYTKFPIPFRILLFFYCLQTPLLPCRHTPSCSQPCSRPGLFPLIRLSTPAHAHAKGEKIMLHCQHSCHRS